MTWTFDAELWPWKESAPDSWTFLTLPPEVTDAVKATAGPRRGFGSVRVEATLGDTTWQTSVFPGRAGFELPVKKAVRAKEQVEAGDVVQVTITLA